MKPTGKRILIIDDEETIRDGCQQTLSRLGHQVESTGDAVMGCEMALRDDHDVILLDIRMPRMSGLEMLRLLKTQHEIAARVIIITGYGTIPLAVEAMKLGAINVLTKPFGADELKQAVSEALDDACPLYANSTIAELIGTSDYMDELKTTIRRIAATDSTVLITGESGTGKELVARTIHALSTRSERTFVPVDCSSLVENLMESELFGHVKGAFSGATDNRDEVSNISLKIQAKLLRVLQDHEVPRVGSSVPEKLDVRLITATNRDLRELVQAGEFREDLFYRISVVPIHIRPIREHKSDILPIAQHYLELYRVRHKSAVTCFSEEVKRSLTAYSWPGNIREIKNTIERLCVLCDHGEVSMSDIMYYGQNSGAKAPVVDRFSGKMTLVDVEREHIEKALKHFDYQINKTAQFLGIDRKTLRLKIRAYGIKT